MLPRPLVESLKLWGSSIARVWELARLLMTCHLASAENGLAVIAACKGISGHGSWVDCWR